MFEQQPTKMAAAEALCETTSTACRSRSSRSAPLGTGDDCDKVTHLIEIPGALVVPGDRRLLRHAAGHRRAAAAVRGEVRVHRRERRARSATSRTSPSPTGRFRLMIGFALGSAALALVAFWVTRKGRVSGNVWVGRLGIVAIATPFLASSFGWIFTEMGRQPWVVAPNPNPGGVDGVWLLTARGVSTVTSTGTILTSPDRLHAALRGARRVLVPPHAPVHDPGRRGQRARPQPGQPRQRPRTTRARAARCRSRTERSRRPWSSPPSGSSSSRSCGPATSCSRGSTSASACCSGCCPAATARPRTGTAAS